MKENSIEEDIILLKDFTEGNFKRDKLENYKGSYKMGYFYYKDIQQAIEHILSDYKRVLKENEEIRIKNNAIKRESEAYAEHMIRLDNELNLEKEKSKYEWIRQNCLPQELVNKLYIPVQKVKDKIEELKNISNTEELEDIMNRKNYTISELVQYVLQELLESEE